MTVSINTVLLHARQRLAGVLRPALDAEILLAHSLETSRSFLYANPELALPDERIKTFDRLLQDRVNGTPIAHLTRLREFWSLPLEVSPDTLIPRPETELLVEAALNLIPANTRCRVLDLGTGSGAVALAIASERQDAQIIAVDISEPALEVARSNAARLNIANIEFLISNWFESLSSKFEVVVSNPPYIAAGDAHLHQGDLRFEPKLALVSGADGLDAIRQIISGSGKALRSGGHLLLEHGFEQGAAVRSLLCEGGFREVRTLRDLESRERVTVARHIAQSNDRTKVHS